MLEMFVLGSVDLGGKFGGRAVPFFEPIAGEHLVSLRERRMKGRRRERDGRLQLLPGVPSPGYVEPGSEKRGVEFADEYYEQLLDVFRDVADFWAERKIPFRCFYSFQ